MDLAKLIHLHQALIAAEHECTVLGAELRRLDEREMIPVAVRGNPRVLAEIKVAMATSEELLKQAQGGASGPRAVPS